MALLVRVLSLLSSFDTQMKVAGNRPSHVDIPLRMALWSEFCPFCRLLIPMQQCRERLSHVDIPLRMALLVRVLSLLSSLIPNESDAGNRASSHVDIPLRMALLVRVLSLCRLLIPNESVQGTVCLTSIFLLRMASFGHEIFVPFVRVLIPNESVREPSVSRRYSS
ncbi:hypothetical protein TNCT_349941 [Trichonephila clavata]|uniref:Uncharacterized protein n=1 Tax=Trichonephila clavata TaxID=2740835 RepID=A0A8X6GCM7_TRICU|nr:hypothetical protein TNCT_349941 [Trichonephila clavata]